MRQDVLLEAHHKVIRQLIPRTLHDDVWPLWEGVAFIQGHDRDLGRRKASGRVINESGGFSGMRVEIHDECLGKGAVHRVGDVGGAAGCFSDEMFFAKLLKQHCAKVLIV
jgi:hypothetical protein